MKPSARKKARQLAVQGLYAWQMSENPISEIEINLVTTNDTTKIDLEYFRALINGVGDKRAELDLAIRPYLGRLPEELDLVERAILWVATLELIERIDTPFKVVINEAIELAKVFGAQESHKFINGVLDKAVKSIRKHEKTKS